MQNVKRNLLILAKGLFIWECNVIYTNFHLALTCTCKAGWLVKARSHFAKTGSRLDGLDIFPCKRNDPGLLTLAEFNALFL